MSSSPQDAPQDPVTILSASAGSRRKRKTPDEPNPIPTRLAGSYQRTKAANACLVCRARKTRCDNAWPVCGFCKSTGGECQYTQPSSLRFDQASLTILKQLDRLESLLQSQAELHDRCCSGKPSGPETNGGIAAQSTASQHPHHTSPLSHFHDGEIFSPLAAANSSFAQPAPNVDIPSPGYGVDQYAARIQKSLDVPPGSDVLARATTEMSIEAMLRWPVFAERLPMLGILTHETLPVLLGQVSSNIERDDAQRWASRPDEDISISVNGHTVRHLVENFLVNNNQKNPILQPALLRRDAEEFVAFPDRHGGRSCLVLLVLAVSSISVSLADGASANRISVARNDPAFRTAELYFQASQRRAGALYCENSLLAAQCAFLTGVYLMYTMRIMAAWKAFVQAGTQCLGYFTSKQLVDLDQSAHVTRRMSTAPDLSPGDTSASDLRALEDGLYWSCLKSEIELRLELGLPGSGINGTQYPHIFPSVPTLKDPDPAACASIMSGDRTSSAAASSELDNAHLVTGWFFYLGEIALKRLMYRVLLYRYGDRDEHGVPRGPLAADSEEVLQRSITEFDRQLQQWMQSLPPPMRFSPTSSEPLHDILRWVLRGHRIDVIELLRFPAISAILKPSRPRTSVTSPDENGSIPLYSVTTLRLAREYLDNAVYRIETNAEGLLHRHQGSWLTIRSCSRSALALLGAKLQSQEDHSGVISSILPSTWRDAVIQVLQMLTAWETESRDVLRLREIIEGLLSACYDEGS